MDGLLDELRRFGALRDEESAGDIVSQATLNAIAPTYADSTVFGLLSPKLVTALRGVGVERLFQHQADAIVKAVSGSNVVLQAPTASGKSLAFQVPMLEALSTGSSSRALMIYPNKALALDQRDQLTNLVKQIPGRRIDSWWYDGDRERGSRPTAPGAASDSDHKPRDAQPNLSRSCRQVAAIAQESQVGRS